jgi:hypothetical protein
LATVIAAIGAMPASGLSGANIGNALKIANTNGVDSQVNIPTDYSNVAPRIGFSVSVTPTLVARGGYGLSFFPGNYTSNADLKNAPFTSIFTPSCQSTIAVQIEQSLGQFAGQNPDCASIGAPGALDEGLPTPAAPNLAALNQITGLSFVAEAPKFRSALIQQFNLQVEQQFGPNVWTLGYIENFGQHLPESMNNINQPRPFNPITDPAAQPLGTIGTTQRNSLFGPHYRHVDLSLCKNFPVAERVNLQFRAECFNISNTPNLYMPNGNPGDAFGRAAFGTISQTDPNYTPRQYQFSLQAQF